MKQYLISIKLMEPKEYKSIFSKVAKAHGFEYNFSAWFKESDECVVVLDLQRSNYGLYYQLMIKTYIHFVFGSRYQKTKELVKDIGDTFRSTPPEYKDFFDLEHVKDEADAVEKLNKVFSEFIVPYTNRALNKREILELGKEGLVVLLPAVKKNLLELIGKGN